ncbi:MAG TPA: AAA family ATPase [Parasulfuritortus sp.]
MSIENIRIKHFRSLRDVSFDVENLNVFVGCNDEGKSNLLRALDLFFNEGRRDGYVLDWGKDFCATSITPKNKAEQIEVSITFNLPTFNVGESVVWRRYWRQAGFHREEIKLLSGVDLPSRSKVFAYLKAIRYDYVPAIKGPDYFQKLLASVHDMLDATVRKDIRTAAESFTTEIRNHTKGILSDLEDQLGLKSDIELPADLRKLFSDLEFRSEAGKHRVALAQRGDGIKVRHIPVILRWLADQANHLSAPGKPRIATIWGYEEPENNLETRKCFDLADYFLQTSDSIQTFLTTHSPVFYTVFSEEHTSAKIFEVQLNQDDGTKVTPRSPGLPSDVDALHSSIGFLDLLEPHVLQWKNRVDHLEARLSEGLDLGTATVFVEGPSDKTILEAVLKRYFKENHEIRISCSTLNGGGHAWVKDSLIAWQHSRAKNRAVGLFDADAGSEESLAEFRELVEDRSKANRRAFKIKMKPLGSALTIVKAGIRVPVAIEEICPIEIWNKARKAGWLEERLHMPLLYKFEETNISFNEWMISKLPDTSLRLIATHRVQTDAKEKFAKYVAKCLADDSCKFDFGPLCALAEELIKKLETQTT